MDAATAETIADELESRVDCVTSTIVFRPGERYDDPELGTTDGVPRKEYPAAEYREEGENWYVEFDAELPTSVFGFELPADLLAYLGERSLRLKRDMESDVWEVWEEPETVDSLASEASERLYAVEDGAADPRRPLDTDTVDEAIDAVKTFAAADSTIDEAVFDDVLEDLNAIRSTARSHSRSVDHMAVNDTVESFAEELVDHDYL